MTRFLVAPDVTFLTPTSPGCNLLDSYHPGCSTQDLNVGVDVVFYGKVFRLCDSDKFTKDFLESEGIAVNPAEPVAEDPYNQVNPERK